MKNKSSYQNRFDRVKSFPKTNANRDIDSEALDKAIYFCKEQIKLAPKVKQKLLKESPAGILPVHIGYKQLAIIYEKQKRYAEALKISKEAFAEGWNLDDCSKRIEKLIIKLSK